MGRDLLPAQPTRTTNCTPTARANPIDKTSFVVSTTACGVGDYFWPEVDSEDLWWSDIPSTSIEVGQLGLLESDGCLYRILPDNKSFDVTPTVLGNPSHTGSPTRASAGPFSHFTVYMGYARASSQPQLACGH